MCKEKFFQFQSMSSVIICIDQKFSVKNYDVSCLTLKFDMWNPKMKIWHTTNQSQFARCDDSCTVFRLNNTSLWLSGEGKSQHYLQPLCHFCMALSRQWSDTVRLYCCCALCDVLSL